MRFVLGVDEVGRGPLAGPVAVGVVAVPEGFDVAKEFPGIKDSKKLSEKKREEIFERLVLLSGKGDPGETESLSHGAGVRFTVEFESAEVIDREGIATAVRRALWRGVNSLAGKCGSQTSKGAGKSDFHILLDGALMAPPEYSQETIINGDELIPIISLASIAAKVSRDRLMVGLAKKYPEYGFEKHKGYGTALHYEMLKKHGLCDIHRRSFTHLDFKPK